MQRRHTRATLDLLQIHEEAETVLSTHSFLDLGHLPTKLLGARELLHGLGLGRHRHLLQLREATMHPRQLRRRRHQGQDSMTRTRLRML